MREPTRRSWTRSVATRTWSPSARRYNDFVLLRQPDVELRREGRRGPGGSPCRDAVAAVGADLGMTAGPDRRPAGGDPGQRPRPGARRAARGRRLSAADPRVGHLSRAGAGRRRLRLGARDLRGARRAMADAAEQADATYVDVGPPARATTSAPARTRGSTASAPQPRQPAPYHPFETRAAGRRGPGAEGAGRLTDRTVEFGAPRTVARMLLRRALAALGLVIVAALAGCSDDGSGAATTDTPDGGPARVPRRHRTHPRRTRRPGAGTSPWVTPTPRRRACRRPSRCRAASARTATTRA